MSCSFDCRSRTVDDPQTKDCSWPNTPAERRVMNGCNMVDTGRR